jgi:hypothetical protein
MRKSEEGKEGKSFYLFYLREIKDEVLFYLCMLIKKKKQTTCLISVSNKDDKYRKLL